jgi:dipeptidyl aminopeptidase/acylaminoacyl peptidase
MRRCTSIFLAISALWLLIACQNSGLSPVPPSSIPEQPTTQATITKTLPAPSTAAITPSSPVEGQTPAPIVTEVEETRPPSEDNKGSKLAFISRLGGQTDLWQMSADGTKVERLTNDSQLERWPRWSPDGRQLAYATRPRSPTTSEDLLWMLTSQSQEKRSLVDQKLAGVSAPSWNPESNKIACSTEISNVFRIWLVNADTGEYVEITQHRSNPLWSPNGQFLAVLGPPVDIEFGWSSPVGFFSIITVEGEPLEHVNRGWDWQKHVTGMAWSHVGDRLLVTSEAGKSFMPGVASLEIVEIEAMAASISVNHMMECNDYDCDFYSPSWFPGDKEILFIAAVPLPLRAPYDTPEPDEPEGRWWIYRATDDLGSIQPVFESDLPISDAALSPDGSQVVFVQGEYAEAELWLLDLTSGKVTQLTSNEVNDSSPIWQPEP